MVQVILHPGQVDQIKGAIAGMVLEREDTAMVGIAVVAVHVALAIH